MPGIPFTFAARWGLILKATWSALATRSDLSHIVKTTTYIIDPRYREPVYQEVGKWLKGVFPISTGLVISALAQPQWLMEIDVVAVIPDDAA